MRGRDVRGLVAPDRPGSKRKLKEQENDPPDRQSPQRRDSARVSPNPQTESEHGESDNQSEDRLRKTGMKDSDLILQHGDAQTAENALQNDAGDSNQTEIAQRLSILTAPNPDREKDGEKSYC